MVLICCLFKQALCDHEAYILSDQENLSKAILHAAQAVCNMLKAAAVKDTFLDTGNEAKPQMLRQFTDFAQE